MKTKTVDYGTEHQVKVLSATDQLITVVDENGEGYILLNHGIKELPEVDDVGKITFVKSSSPLHGHWHFQKDK